MFRDAGFGVRTLLKHSSRCKERIETVTDDADVDEVYNTERHLLYVGWTPARNHLAAPSLPRSRCLSIATSIAVRRISTSAV
jgi:hypothetical protein